MFLTTIVEMHTAPPAPPPKVEAHRELEEQYALTLQDPTFQEEVAWYRREFIGGPTPLYFAKRMTEVLLVPLHSQKNQGWGF